MNGILTVAFLGVLIASFAGGSASAGEVKVGGSVRYKVEPSGQEDLGGGRLVVSQRLRGQLEADDKNSPLNKSAQECVGSFVIENGVAVQGHGYCVATDATHDVWWLIYSAGTQESEWTVVGGIGKYAGMKGSGKTTYASDQKAIAAADGWAQKYSGTLTFP